jgi:hypothetical protein
MRWLGTIRVHHAVRSLVARVVGYFLDFHVASALIHVLLLFAIIALVVHLFSGASGVVSSKSLFEFRSEGAQDGTNRR